MPRNSGNTRRPTKSARRRMSLNARRSVTKKDNKK